MKPHDAPLYRLIVEIRGAFNDLKAFSDAMIADLGITAAMRAVIEHLDRTGPQTVPKIAEAKRVSRQNIQLLVDALAERGLVTLQDNPAHKRSRLVCLTEAGRRLFDDVQDRESKALDDLSARLGATDHAATARTIADLRVALNEISPPDQK